MTEISLFTIPVLLHKSELPHEAIESYVRETLSEYNEYTSYYDEKYNELMTAGQPFRKQMEESMTLLSRQYLKKRGASKDVIDRSRVKWWYSMYDANESHCLHIHPRSLVAGTYYPYSDKDSSSLRFRNPSALLIKWSESWEGRDDAEYKHKPVTGDMLVWPPWLEHEVRPQKTVKPDKARIAISWNFG